MSVKLLTEQHLEFLSLKGDCTGLCETTLVKTPHCWKSHVPLHFYLQGYGTLVPHSVAEEQTTNREINSSHTCKLQGQDTLNVQVNRYLLTRVSA